MLHYSKFIQDFMKRYDYPKEAEELFSDILLKLDRDQGFAKKVDECVNTFRCGDGTVGSVLPELSRTAVLKGIKPYSLHFVYLLLLTEDLYKQYKLMGVDDEIYWDTMADLRYKLMECIECKGYPGTFVADWFDGFFRMKRVAYGRFQYEIGEYHGKEHYLKSGRILEDGDIFIGFHIPSSGVPLTDEIRFDSYRRAYKVFAPLFPDGKVLFGCGSWLLYPAHRDFLPSHLNILKFMDDFEMISTNEDRDFHDAWRVFGKDAKLPYDRLPRDTSLKKAYAKRLYEDGRTGGGFGVILFDGENIVR